MCGTPPPPPPAAAAPGTAVTSQVKTQISQLLEWRRQLQTAEAVRGVDAHTALVRDRVMRLVESATQIRQGLLVPRTDNDEVGVCAHARGWMRRLRLSMYPCKHANVG